MSETMNAKQIAYSRARRGMDLPHGLHAQDVSDNGRVWCMDCDMRADGTAWDRARATWVRIVPIRIVTLPIV